MGKHVPAWSKTYLQMLEQQTPTDPDTIFGCRVPKVDLEAIFSDLEYQKVHKQRPKRRRGSSGEWKHDRLSKVEVDQYKRKMGQVKRWSVEKGVAFLGA